MVEIKKLDELHLDELSAFLNLYQETTMFLRNNLYHSGVCYRNEPFHGEYYGSFIHNKLNGVLAHYWNGNVMMQTENHSALSALVDQFKHKRSRAIAGILGEDSQASFVIEKLDIESSQFSINYQEQLYLLHLEQIKAPKGIQLDACVLKSIQNCDVDLIKKWLVDYHIEALGANINTLDLEEVITDEMQNPSLSQNRWVLFVHNSPVSLCGFNAQLPEIVQLGPVYTPPLLRKNGFARTAVYFCLKQAALKQVERSVLFTNDKYAIRAYESLGFQEIGKYRLALLNSLI